MSVGSEMGASKQRKREFLRDNPICCFCGGENASEEPDHMPSRTLFLDRQWPEGYEFPSCVSCNRVSRYDELVVSLLSRLNPDPTTEMEEVELNKCANSVNKYIPEVVEEIQISPAKKKRLAKEHGYLISSGKTSNDIPLFSLEGERTNKAVLNFSRKLMLALYYKHACAILPKEGGIVTIWYSNLQVANGSIPDEVNQFLNQNPALIRNSKNLNEQFNYKYLFSECRQNAVFLVGFRQSFYILSHLKTDRSGFDKSICERVMSPYRMDEKHIGIKRKLSY